MDIDLSLRIIYDLFNYDDPKYEANYKDSELLIINLNSVFSTAFYEPMINEFKNEERLDFYVEKISEMFKKLLIRFSSQRIIIVYSDMKANFIEIYKDWRKKRYQNKTKNEFAKVVFNHFIDVFNKIEEVSPTVDIIHTDEFDPALFTHFYIYMKNYDKKIFLISRDRLDFLNLEHENVLMFDGQQYYTEESFKNHEVKKLPKINIHFLKFYYRLRGIKKYDYPGVRGYGPKRSIRYIKENIDNLVDGYDKYCDKQLLLFYFDKYIEDFLDKEKREKLSDIINKSKF